MLAEHITHVLALNLSTASFGTTEKSETGITNIQRESDMHSTTTRRVPFLKLSLLCVAALGVAACSKQAPAPTPAAQPSLVERGAYLVAIGGCNDCHSPKVFGPNGPEVDKNRALSGHPADQKLPAIPAGIIAPDQWGGLATNDLTAWAGPWGVSYAANLTPDPTGLGGWTPETFIQAMRTGKHVGVGRPILPPMPWQAMGRMSDEDLRAMFAYLKSLQPVHNEVPAPTPPVSAH
jgi:mono/diheme cytochrome c family protein